jgi:small subunit ribosomal protein S35
MGEEHPAEKKVVVEFCPDDIPGLSPVEKDKLKKLVGVRYNPTTEIVKMSSEMFESQAQNKRYLGDLVDSLVREAKVRSLQSSCQHCYKGKLTNMLQDPTDTFEDIPLDTRHHTFKTKPKFPREWRITPERQAQLEAERVAALRLDQAKMEEGLFIDGQAIIREAHEQAAERAGAARLEEAAMPVPSGKGGKGPKRVSIRR